MKVLALVFLCWVFIAACSENDKYVVAIGKLYRDCGWIDTGDVTSHCFFLPTEEFRLPVAILLPPDLTLKSVTNVVVQIPGGPGQGDTTAPESLEFWAQQMLIHRWRFALVLYDPRGTSGTANPLFCDNLQDAMRQVLGEALPLQQEVAFIHGSLQSCYESLQARPSHPQGQSIASRFNTRKNVEDLNRIIAVLPDADVHLWGTSYGTRIAMAAAPNQRVASLMLDSPYPFSRGSIADTLSLYAKHFEHHQRLYREFSSDKTGDYGEVFTQIQEHLRASPVAFSLPPEVLKHDFVMTSHRWLDLSFAVLYRSELFESYYRGLDTWRRERRFDEDFRWVLSLLTESFIDPSFSVPVYIATECADNAPESEAALRESAAQYPSLAEYFLPYLDYDSCDIFTPAVDTPILALPKFTKPTLIVSGEYDPITPVTWAQDLASEISSSVIEVVEGQGHGALHDGACDMTRLNAWVDGVNYEREPMCRGEPPWL